MRTRHIIGMLVAVVLGVAALPSVAVAQTSQEPWTLTAVCTPAEDFPGSRQFRIHRPGGSPGDFTLWNAFGGRPPIQDVAPEGDSYWLVPAAADVNSSNTTWLFYPGGATAMPANYTACLTLSGQRRVRPGERADHGHLDGQGRHRHGDRPAHHRQHHTARPGVPPNPVPADGGVATAIEVIAGPAVEEVRTASVTTELPAGVTTSPSATITVSPCVAPIPPPVTFTLTKTPDRTDGRRR